MDKTQKILAYFGKLEERIAQSVDVEEDEGGKSVSSAAASSVETKTVTLG